ncbi:O-methyltransferase [Melioribacteraceae bacterium 4301-Me]|uniref:O-methyltransferase n=1 Tax=Pyranulibacter aquaticus TaxID=3163344 RepID=UPI00359B4925
MPRIIYSNQINYLQRLRITNDPLILEMEEYAYKNNVPILDWMSAELMEQLILIHKPKKVLEIGTAIAYSSIRIAKCLRKGSAVDTIEKSKDNIKIAKENIKKARLTNFIRILEGNALDIIPHLDEKYDFIFLDADKEDYEKLFFYSLMVLKKGGVIFVDNLLWHGYAASTNVPAKYRRTTKYIREFNKLFTSSDLLKTTILTVGDGIGIGVKIAN